jgi:uncharacterized protein YheU (UPF0270 family)
MAQKNENNHLEQGIDVPYDQLAPATLRNLIEEFVTREWSELSDSGFSLADKIEQVLQQLQEKKAKVVFDFTSNTANIVVCR